MLHSFAENGITHLILEISSSGLVRKRVANIPLDLAVWTSFSSEHLETHGTLAEYWKAKMEILALLKKYGKFLIGQELEERIAITGAIYEVYNREYLYHHPDYRFFMQDNLQGSCKICEFAGFTHQEIQKALNQLEGTIPGRLEFISKDVVVDFAHNPNSLERLLSAFRDRAIVLVFGCGGERDPSKRPMMGRIASKYATVTIVTDDNPRTEDPGLIRHQILNQCNGLEIPDRHEAIKHGIRTAKEIGGICIIAGKGRETVQLYHEARPFSDLDEARKILKTLEV
jgi:UDP-N-acetylmuramoyl-L-alanyl-D-glutamate--2,6-diaminopimelate ligase